MDIPVEPRSRREFRVDIGEQGGGDAGGDDGVNERINGRSEEELVYVEMERREAYLRSDGFDNLLEERRRGEEEGVVHLGIVEELVGKR